MGNETKVKHGKAPNVLIALLPIFFLVGILVFFILVLKQDVHIPLILSSVFAAGVAVLFLGTPWSDIEAGIMKTINMGMQAIIILMIIGILIGTWLVSGIVPALIYYGLKLIAPSIFLAAAMLICSVVSLATGTSWATAGTIGVALIGIGHGLGFPLPMVAGAVVSGAYFGDKMSPLSDTTNLAPAMAGATLFDHIKHMVWTTGPTYLISITLFLIIGFTRKSDAFDPAQVESIINALGQQFYITPWLLIPPILVVLIVVLKVPAIPGLLGGAALGVIFAMIFQGASFGDTMNIAQNGFSVAFDNPTAAQSVIMELLNRGGMQSMMWTVSLIICALTFGGIMEATGMLELLASKLLKLAVNTGMLVTVTIASCIFVNIIAADQYLAIVVPGRMYKDAFAKRRLAPKNLSRTLEDAGTLTSALVPWNTCGAFMANALGVPTVEYLPWAFLNVLNPFVAIIMAFLGIKQTKMTDAEYAEYEASLTHA